MSKTRARTLLTIAIAVYALASLGGACPGPAPGPPPADTCDNAQAGSLAALELGGDNETSFQPWQDGGIAHLTFGGQGGRMIVVRLRGSGTVPMCLAQHTTVSQRGAQIGSNATPAVTYAEGAARTTKDIYVVLSTYPESGDQLTVTSVAGGTTVSRVMYLDQAPDGGQPDSSIPDAGTD